LTQASALLQALADLLEETHRGYFIFPRPDKGALEGAAAGRSEVEFVEARRAELERYLRRLSRHPVLGNSEVRLPCCLEIVLAITSLAMMCHLLHDLDCVAFH